MEENLKFIKKNVWVTEILECACLLKKKEKENHGNKELYIMLCKASDEYANWENAAFSNKRKRRNQSVKVQLCMIKLQKSNMSII